MPNLLKMMKRVAVKQYQAETLDWRDRVTAAGGTLSVATLDHVEAFVRDCKEYGIWSKLTEVGVFAGNQLAAALVKLKHAGTGTITNVNFVAGDYTEATGLLGDGTTKYLNLTYNANLLGDTGHMSFYLREDPVVGSNRGFIGAFADANNQHLIGALLPGTDISARWGQTTTAAETASPGKGFYTGVRSANNDLRMYKNGTQSQVTTTATTQTKLNGNLYGWAWNVGGVVSNRLNSRGSFYSFGTPLTASEVLNFARAVQRLQVNLGRAV